jgi:hypothetical protein
MQDEQKKQKYKRQVELTRRAGCVARGVCECLIANTIQKEKTEHEKARKND